MSTYSSNLKIELIGTGEQVGTWGTTTNSNFSNVFEQAIVGRGSVVYATDANVTLTYTDSVASQTARNVYLNLTSSGSLTATRELVVPTINKNYVIQNNTTGGQSITIKTSAGTGITVPNGFTCALYVDGINVIQASDYLPTLTIGTLNVTTLDLTNLEVTNIKAQDGAASASIANSTGVMTIASSVLTTADINGGTIDGTAIGSASASSGAFTTLAASGTTTLSSNAIISVNSASDALRITQLGTGNALLVEDSSNPDSTPFVINANGNAVVGATAPLTNLAQSGTPKFQVLGSGNAAGIGIIRTDASGPILSLNGGSFGNNMASGSGAGFISAGGYDGTNYIETGRIEFRVDGTPGTNNMPGRLVFSTTADGASSPTERMRIDNAGRVGFGGATGPGNYLSLAGNLPVTSADSIGVNLIYTIPSTSTASSRGFFTQAISTQATAFTLPTFRHFEAGNITLGAGSSLTEQIGFRASAMTSGTNIFGFRSELAAGTGRWNFYANGTADNYFAGRVGIGSTSLAGYILRVGGNITGSTFARAIQYDGSVSSDVTNTAYAIRSTTGTAASAFTLANLNHFYASQGTIGATSAVTNQFGFAVESSLTGATNNYGFYSNIPSGTGRWNFYASGTADNFFGGDVGIGTSSPSAKLNVSVSDSAGTNARIDVTNPESSSLISLLATGTAFSTGGWPSISDAGIVRSGSGASGGLVLSSGASGASIIFAPEVTERMRITATGDVGIGTSSPNTKLETVGTIRASRSGSPGTYMEMFGGSGVLDPYINVPSGFGINFQVGGTERMRIDASGNLLVGTTSNPLNGRLNVYGRNSDNPAAMAAQPFVNGAYALGVQNASGTNVGGIIANASTTSYNVTSDYRLKNTVEPMTGALVKVAQLKPVTYKWKVDGSNGQGFIAHELAEVFPDAVSGEKDAVDGEGKPRYQGIDTSFLVATLTAAIQEQQAIITDLKSRIEALESK